MRTKSSGWSRPETGPLKRRIHEWLAVLVLFFRKFDDEDGVFGSKSDQHHETDLGVDVTFDLHHVSGQEGGQNGAPQPQDGKRSKNRDRRAEKNAERKRPAFI